METTETVLEKEWKQALNYFSDGLALGLDPKDEVNRSTYQKIIYWLAKVYMRADWSKIARSKNVYRENVFEHVIKAGAGQPNIRRVNDRICCDLGLQSLAIPTMILDELEKNKRIVLQALRKEAIYYTLKAMELASLFFSEKTYKRI